MNSLPPIGAAPVGAPTPAQAPLSAPVAASAPVDSTSAGVPPSVDFNRAAAILLAKKASPDLEQLRVPDISVTGSPQLGSDGAIYASSRNVDQVRSFRADDGSARWTSPVKVASAPLLCPDGTLLVGGQDGRIHALDTLTGADAWSIPAGTAAFNPFVGGDGRIYVTARQPVGTVLLQIDPLARGVTGTTKLEHGFEDSVVVGPDGTIYGGGHDGDIYALEPNTGNVKWQCPTGGMVRNSPAVGPDGTVYGGCIGKALVAVDPQTGKEKWRFDAPHWLIASPVVGPDGTVYAGCNDNNLYALDPATGKPKWTFETNGEVRVSPVPAADGLVYVVSDRNRMFALDQGSGVEMWHKDCPSYVHCPPAADGKGGIVFGSNDSSMVIMRDTATQRRTQLEELTTAEPTIPKATPTIEQADDWITIDGIRIPRNHT